MLLEKPLQLLDHQEAGSPQLAGFCFGSMTLQAVQYLSTSKMFVTLLRTVCIKLSEWFLKILYFLMIQSITTLHMDAKMPLIAKW